MSGYLDAAGHSIAAVRGVHGKSSHCYVIYTPIKSTGSPTSG